MILKRLFGLLLLIAVVCLLYIVIRNQYGQQSRLEMVDRGFSETEKPLIYQQPKLDKNRSYRLVVVGDSMTKALGPSANRLREYLIENYPENEFVIYNYGYSSTNIESLPKRLTEKTSDLGSENEAILKQGFELILIESFGYNPLSEKSLEDGLKKQEKVLDESLKLVIQEKPNSAILFMTPIAPDPETFAKNTHELSPEVRREWVEDRVKYIENFKKYAASRNVPLIDVYAASLNNDGSINKSYISGDYIHPSEKGVDFMAREIADFIATNEIIPK